MFIYSVHIEITKDRADEWMDYMNTKHLSDVMATACFEKCEMLVQIEPDDTEFAHFISNYYLKSLDKMTDYRLNHSTRLQAEPREIFGDDFKAHRELYVVKGSI